MLLQLFYPGYDDVVGSFLLMRASRPHYRLSHPRQSPPHASSGNSEPWLCFGLFDAVPAHRVAACSIPMKLSGGQRDRMRAGRPRSQAIPSRRCRGGGLAGDFSDSRPAPFGKLPLPASRAPAPGPGGSLQSETTDFCGLSRARTLSGEAGWRQSILSIPSIN